MKNLAAIKAESASGVDLPDGAQLREQAAKVCHYLGGAYDGEPRRVIEALVRRAYGVKTSGENNDK